MSQIINTSNAPKAIGPYSQAVQAGSFFYVSGQLPINPATEMIVGDDITVQTRQSLINLENIINAAGMSLNNVVKVTVYLSNMNNFTAMNEVYATFFKVDFPARVAVEVVRLPKDALVEMDAVAFKG
jgi:2-iminobutanoate/2-iminopropanoate deaminase